MKTPRELLLARHDAAAPELDARRRRVLPEPRVGFVAFLLLVFFPQRLLWGALALVWAAIAALSLADGRPTRGPHSSATRELIAGWTANQDKLHDLFAETGPRR
jgi:hypothetical protein